MSRQANYITETRQAARAIWDGLNQLKAAQREYNALDYGSTLVIGVGENDGITAADVGAVVFASADAIEALLNTGHATNIAKLL